jgi:membrane-bound lytic murein transglycosylase B
MGATRILRDVVPNRLLGQFAILAVLATVAALLAACSPPPAAGPVKLTEAVASPLLPPSPAASPSPSPSPSPSVAPSPVTPPAPASSSPVAPKPKVVPAPAAPVAPARPELFAQATALQVSDPETLASRLTDAEQGIRSAGTPLGELQALGMAQQAAYRQLVGHPEWRPVVLARMPAALRPVVEANIEAGSQLRILTKPMTTLPPWRIVAPPPAEELLADYRAAEAAFRIPWPYLAAIHLVETRMGRIRGASTAGAQGPMQFLPSTWAAYGQGDIDNPRDAVMAAARYLDRNGGPEDMAGALFAYNHAQTYVRAIELYAAQMRTDERAFLGYYHWQVYYHTTTGDALLPEGYQG